MRPSCLLIRRGNGPPCSCRGCAEAVIVPQCQRAGGAHRPHPLDASQQGRWAPRAAETPHALPRRWPGVRCCSTGQGCLMTLTMPHERAECLGSQRTHEHLARDRGRDPRTYEPPTPGEVVHKTDMDESKAFPSRKAHVRPQKAALGPRPAGMALSCSSACTKRRRMRPACAHQPLPAPSCAHRGHIRAKTW